jgi:type IV pilus assembly protein PilC
MAEYVIKVADERGRQHQNIEHGFSEAEVRERYVQQGYLVYWVRPRGMLAGGQLQLGRRRKVKLDQFVIFNQQFLTLVKAGLPIMNALDLLVKRQKNPYFRQLLENVRDRVRSGELLSEAFAAQGSFPKIYTTTILAGEKSGNLEEVLGRYLNFQRLTMSFRKKLAVSLVYPALLVIAVTVMLTFLVTYVVPQFAKLYEGLNATLPAPTVAMLAVGTAAQKYFIFILLGIALVVFLAWRWKQSDHGAETLDHVRLRLPLLGGVWLKYQVATFSRMMSTLLSGGLPLVPALETAGGSMGSRFLAQGLAAASQHVREGKSLSTSIEEQKIFPEMAVEMLEVGESTGALPAMLNSVAEFYEEDVQNALTAALSLIEPAILIFMAVIVGFVLISLYLPIFSLGLGGIH